jgi:hypothetical protein
LIVLKTTCMLIFENVALLLVPVYDPLVCSM